LTETTWTPNRQGQQRHKKYLLLLASVTLGLGVFLILDFSYSAAKRRYPTPTASSDSCRMADPVRHHAFLPNCSASDRWGRASYDFVTNSLGFRDQRIRQVPLSDPRPRLLLLGDSFTEGKLPWGDSYAGRITLHFPQYDVLNGGVASYSPSNYLNTAKMVLAKGIDIDEVVVFLDISDVQDEAALYRDADATGAVKARLPEGVVLSGYALWRTRLSKYFVLTSSVLRSFEQLLVRVGLAYPLFGPWGNVFDMERAAWSYRSVNQTYFADAGYAPLGAEGGIAKEKAKMTLLWQLLQERNIPLSVVVYPYPSQLVHDTVDSRQVTIWRKWCQGKCKRFVSVFPAFFAAKDRCPRLQAGCWYPYLFVFGDFHYNAAGNALVADAVISSLTEAPPVKRQAIPPQPEQGQAPGAH